MYHRPISLRFSSNVNNVVSYRSIEIASYVLKPPRQGLGNKRKEKILE